MTTKILALTDALGNLVHFVLLPGHRFDTIGVEPLIAGVGFDALLADRAFDSNAIIAELDRRDAKTVISQHPRRAQPIEIDTEMYKWRHLIENFSPNSKSSSASPGAPTKPIEAARPSSASPPPSSIHHESQQTLVHRSIRC